MWKGIEKDHNVIKGGMEIETAIEQKCKSGNVPLWKCSVPNLNPHSFNTWALIAKTKITK